MFFGEHFSRTTWLAIAGGALLLMTALILGSALIDTAPWAPVLLLGGAAVMLPLGYAVVRAGGGAAGALGAVWVAVGVGAMPQAGTGMGLTFLALGVLLLAWAGGAYGRRAWWRRHGLPAEVRVLEARPTGRVINNVMMGWRARVRMDDPPDGGESVERVVRVTTPIHTPLRAGDHIAVRVHPVDRTRLRVDRAADA